MTEKVLLEADKAASLTVFAKSNGVQWYVEFYVDIDWANRTDKTR